jgi:hypothetical protein
MKIVYDKSKLADLLKNINDGQHNFIRPYSYNHKDAIRIDDKSNFISVMPFSGVQYMYIDSGKCVISNSYNTYKKSISNQVVTKNDFFKAFSQLNLTEVIDEEILQMFPDPDELSESDEDDYDVAALDEAYQMFRLDNDDIVSNRSYQVSSLGDSTDDLDFEWNPYLETYTLGGL